MKDLDHVKESLKNELEKLRRQIVDLREKEKLLFKERNKFSTIINSLPGIFYLHNDKEQLVSWNKKLEKVTGYSAKEISKMRPLDFIDRENKSRVENAIQEVLIRGEYTIEADLLLKDGKKIPYFFTGSRIELDDFQGLAGMGIDISQRLRIENALQKSEEKFRDIFNNARDGILLADIETKKFILGNAMICQMLGYGVDELMTMGVEDIHPAENLPEVIDRFEKLARQEATLVADIPVMRKDGSLFFADINSFFMELNGKTYLVGFFRDITERKRAEEELRCVLEDLEQRVQERTMELRQAVAQLQQEVTERQRTEEAIRESEAKLRSLTQRVLALQEKERQQLSWDLQEDLAQYITALKLELRTFEPKLREGDEKLRQDYRQALNKINVIVENLRRRAMDLSPQLLSDLGLTVGLKSMCENFCRIHNLECDLHLNELNQFFNAAAQIGIYRVFEEALENIFQHAAASKVTLAAKSKDDEVEFLVEDNGQGFDPAIADARQGVGLSAMAERIRALGGTFKLESQIALGTRILFTIPRTGK